MVVRVAFDADGTVVDSRAVAWNAAAAIRNLFDGPHSITCAEDAESVFGVPAQIGLVGESHASALRMLHRLVMRHRATTLPLFKDVLEAISNVSAPRIVITAALADGIRSTLGDYASLFDEILGFESGRKPDLLARLASKEQLIYVTDSERDIRICNELTIPTVAVTWGYDTTKMLVAAGPFALVQTPRELSKVLRTFIASRG